MKAAELYKQWIREVSSDWGALGVTNLPGRACKWQTEFDNRLLLLFVETNHKYPWTIYGGSDFTLNAYLPRERPEKPDKYTEDVFDGISFFDYWSDEHAKQRHDLNRKVFEKLKNLDEDWLYGEMADLYDCTPEAAREIGLYESTLEIIEMEVEAPSEAVVNPPLYYYDADDVTAWTSLFSAALPGALQGVRENPRYSFSGAD